MFKKKHLIAGIILILITVGATRDNLTFFHPQGRYLYPIIGLAGYFYTQGLDGLITVLVPNCRKATKEILFFILIFGPLIWLNLISLRTVARFY